MSSFQTFSRDMQILGAWLRQQVENGVLNDFALHGKVVDERSATDVAGSHEGEPDVYCRLDPADKESRTLSPFNFRLNDFYPDVREAIERDDPSLVTPTYRMEPTDPREAYFASRYDEPPRAGVGPTIAEALTDGSFERRVAYIERRFQKFQRQPVSQQKLSISLVRWRHIVETSAPTRTVDEEMCCIELFYRISWEHSRRSDRLYGEPPEPASASYDSVSARGKFTSWPTDPQIIDIATQATREWLDYTGRAASQATRALTERFGPGRSLGYRDNKALLDLRQALTRIDPHEYQHGSWLDAVWAASACAARGLSVAAGDLLDRRLTRVAPGLRTPPCPCGEWARWLDYTHAGGTRLTDWREALSQAEFDARNGVARTGCPVRAWMAHSDQAPADANPRGQIVGLQCQQTLTLGEMPGLELHVIHTPRRTDTRFEVTCAESPFLHNGRVCTQAALRDGDLIESCGPAPVGLRYGEAPIDVVAVRLRHDPARVRHVRIEPSAPKSAAAERWPHEDRTDAPDAQPLPPAPPDHERLQRLFLEPCSEASWTEVVTLGASASADGNTKVVDAVVDWLETWTEQCAKPPCPCGQWRDWFAQLPRTSIARDARIAAANPCRQGGPSGPWPGCPARTFLVGERSVDERLRHGLALRCAQGLVAASGDSDSFETVALDGPRYRREGLFKLSARPGRGTLHIEAYSAAALGRSDTEGSTVTLSPGQSVSLHSQRYRFFDRVPPGTLQIMAPDGTLDHFFALDLSEVHIGRSGDNHVRINSPAIARRQCTLRYRDGQHLIVDESSTGGTYVDGSRLVGERPVGRSNIIRVGQHRLAVEPL